MMFFCDVEAVTSKVKVTYTKLIFFSDAEAVTSKVKVTHTKLIFFCDVEAVTSKVKVTHTKLIFFSDAEAVTPEGEVTFLARERVQRNPSSFQFKHYKLVIETFYVLFKGIMFFKTSLSSILLSTLIILLRLFFVHSPF